MADRVVSDEQLTEPRIDFAAVRRDLIRANDPAVAGEGRRVVESRVRYAASALLGEVERLTGEVAALRQRIDKAEALLVSIETSHQSRSRLFSGGYSPATVRTSEVRETLGLGAPLEPEPLTMTADEVAALQAEVAEIRAGEVDYTKYEEIDY